MKNKTTNPLCKPAGYANRIGASILVTALVGCAPLQDKPPTSVSDAGAESERSSGEERSIELSQKDDRLVVSASVSEEVQRSFPSASSYYIEVDDGGSAQIHLVDASGQVVRMIHVDSVPTETGAMAARLSFPPIMAGNCFTPPCPWETPREGMTVERRGNELRLGGRVGRSVVGAHAMVQDDGTISRLTSTMTEPVHEADLELLEASVVVLRDVRALIGTGPTVPDPYASSWKCTLGKTLGWLAVGALVATCCVGSSGVACGVCTSVGTADAGLIGEIC